MLVLTRRPGEAVIIGESSDIVVTMLEITGKQAKIGVTAPREVGVHRHEVYQRIHGGSVEVIGDSPAVRLVREMGLG